jgi:hypothetical protein
MLNFSLVLIWNVPVEGNILERYGRKNAYKDNGIS